MSALDLPHQKGCTTEAIKSYIKENCNSYYNSFLSSSLILSTRATDVFPTVLSIFPRNKINLLDVLAQKEQNFIITHTVRRGGQTPTPPAFRERCGGQQRDSFLGRVNSDLGPAEREKFRRGERHAFPQ